MLIRTGGEYRISNFLLWQIAYSELYFTEVLWADFNGKLTPQIEEGITKVSWIDQSQISENLKNSYKNISDLIRLHLVSRSKIYHIRVVENLFSAGFLFGSYKPSLVVIDVCFPDIDLMQVCKEMKENGFSHKIKIMIINSGRSQKSFSSISDFISSRIYNVPEEISELMESL